MKNRNVSRAICVGTLALLGAAAATLAQSHRPMHFSGVFNDYSPATVTPAGPWEIRGPWRLTLHEEEGTVKADFSATLTMELSDYTRTPANVNSTSGATSRMQHTHHIRFDGGTIAPIADGFEVTGNAASVTKDGSPAPFAPPTVVIDITGGTTVEYSNVTLRFEGGATGHFGSQTIHGVVQKTRGVE